MRYVLIAFYFLCGINVLLGIVYCLGIDYYRKRRNRCIELAKHAELLIKKYEKLCAGQKFTALEQSKITWELYDESR